MMNKRNDYDEHRPSPSPFTSAWIAMWMSVLLQNILKIIGGGDGDGGRGSIGSPPPGGPGRSTTTTYHLEERRSVVSYISSGITKVEQIRRSASIRRQYTETLTTIKLTQKAIGGVPRRSRYLFKRYGDVLEHARKRVRGLYGELRSLEEHLRRYNRAQIEEEIDRLERTVRRTGDDGISPASTRLASRRELLTSLDRFDGRIRELAAQIGAIAAALELNHMRVISIASATAVRPATDLVDEQLAEASEQLALLEETLREEM